MYKCCDIVCKKNLQYFKLQTPPEKAWLHRYIDSSISIEQMIHHSDIFVFPLLFLVTKNYESIFIIIYFYHHHYPQKSHANLMVLHIF